METISHDVGSLAPVDRAAVERLVGHQLGGDELLVIQVVPPTATTPSHVELSGFPECFRDFYKGLSDAEVDEIEQAILERDTSCRSTDI